MMRATLIKDIEPTLPPYPSSPSEELRWRAPGIDRTLDNRV